MGQATALAGRTGRPGWTWTDSPSGCVTLWTHHLPSFRNLSLPFATAAIRDFPLGPRTARIHPTIRHPPLSFIGWRDQTRRALYTLHVLSSARAVVASWQQRARGATSLPLYSIHVEASPQRAWFGWILIFAKPKLQFLPSQNHDKLKYWLTKIKTCQSVGEKFRYSFSLVPIDTLFSCKVKKF